MKTDARNSDCRRSQAVYGRLLRAYPRRHRDQFGAAMAQLFRDQCRDAWEESRTWGLLKLWSRVLPDLACTSILERLAALKERKTMNEKLGSLLAFRITPASTFFWIFTLVFLAVFSVSVAITYILPESYASTARLKLDMPKESGGAYDPYFIQTSFEVMQSEAVLRPVVDKLNLNQQWGKKYFNGQQLKSTETMEILRQRLQLAPVKNTSLIAVTVFSEDRREAADLANAVATAYRDYCAQSRAEQLARAREALETQSQVLENQIRQARAELEELQKKFGISDNVEGLGPTLVTMESSLQKTKIELAQLRPLSPEQLRQMLPMMTSDTALGGLLGKLQDARQQYVTLTNDYALTNLVVARVASLIEELNRQIDDRVAGVMAGLEAMNAANQAAANALGDAIQRSRPSPENQPYWDAKHRLEQLTAGQQMLSGRLVSARLDEQLPRPQSVQITDAAEPGRAPVKPNKVVNIVVGGFMAGFCGVVAAGLATLLTWRWGSRRLKSQAAG